MSIMNATMTGGQAAHSPCPHTGQNASLLDVVSEATGSNANKCYQCIKCTSGCPLADQFDLTPNQVMRSVQLNDTAVLESRSIWLCASCHTCTTRCPQELDVTGVMDALRIESRKRGVKPAVAEVARFNELFMRGLKIFGRTYELGLVTAFNMALGRPLRDAALGRKLLLRGKLKFLPHFAKGKVAAQKIQPKSNAVAYYPGCSLSSSSIEYGKSVKHIAEALDIELVEPQDWVCCGSSPAHATDAQAATLLPMRTVATVEQMGFDTVTSPCSACFSRLKHAEQAVSNSTEVSQSVSEVLGYEYRGSVNVEHLLDVIVDRAGLDEVGKRVINPLKGVKVACYYGCLITRPSRVTGSDHVEYPHKMEHLINVLGAETVDWSRKTECCGGGLAISKTEVALKLMKRIMDDARACGAEAIVTMCPICHLNLDSRQQDMGFGNDAIPVFQATQLMALAFGQGKGDAAIANNLIDPKPYLRERGLL